MAAKYRKIDPRIWRDERFVKLTPDEKLVAIYCLTAQSNRCGIFVFSIGMAAEELGTLPRTFQERFEKVISTLHWRWDQTTRVLYFPTWWKYNQPENINIMKGNLKDLDDLPQTPLIYEFLENYSYLTPNLTETLPKGYPKPSPIQEQEQEQDKSAAKRRDTPFKPPSIEEVSEYCKERGNSVDPHRFIDFYTSKGWKVGNQKMKDWRAAIRTWEGNGKASHVPSQPKLSQRERILAMGQTPPEQTS